MAKLRGWTDLPVPLQPLARIGFRNKDCQNPCFLLEFFLDLFQLKEATCIATTS
jgi:hypothetical protein